MVNTFKTGGRGRKQCRACGLFVGNRVAVCACGAKFAAKASAKAKEAPKPAVTVQPKPVPAPSAAQKTEVKPVVKVDPKTEKAALEFFRNQAAKHGDSPTVTAWACFGVVKGATVTPELIQRANAECLPLMEKWAEKERSQGRMVFVKGI